MDKLICVGKNYLDHAKELGDAVPEMPVLFLKPPSVLVECTTPGGTVKVALPTDRGSVHHECEIIARVKVEGGIAKIDAVTLGLDMTLRDVQAQLKKSGHPWEIAKVFAGSAILGPWISASDFPGYLEAEFTFTVDGSVRQKGRGSEMRLKPEDCLKYAGSHFPLRTGDALFTGTPAGVGPVSPETKGVLQWGNRLRFEVVWT